MKTYINGYDARQKWGVTLDTKGLSALMTPAPRKAPVTNGSRLEHGVRQLDLTPRFDEREVVMTLNFAAKDAETFLANYAAFVRDVLEQEIFTLLTDLQPGVHYRLTYVSCTAFTEYQLGMAHMTARFREPNPGNRE